MWVSAVIVTADLLLGSSVALPRRTSACTFVGNSFEARPGASFSTTEWVSAPRDLVLSDAAPPTVIPAWNNARWFVKTVGVKAD